MPGMSRDVSLLFSSGLLKVGRTRFLYGCQRPHRFVVCHGCFGMLLVICWCRCLRVCCRYLRFVVENDAFIDCVNVAYLRSMRCWELLYATMCCRGTLFVLFARRTARTRSSMRHPKHSLDSFLADWHRGGQIALPPAEGCRYVESHFDTYAFLVFAAS